MYKSRAIENQILEILLATTVSTIAPNTIQLIVSAFLHLVTGTIFGAIFGGIAVRVEMRKNIMNVFSPYKSILMGTGTGIVLWLLLFLPVTALAIQPFHWQNRRNTIVRAG